MYWRDILNDSTGAVMQSHMSITALDDDGYLVSLDEPVDQRRLQLVGVLAHTPEQVDAYLRERGVSLTGWIRAM